MKTFPLNLQELQQVIKEYPTPFYIYEEAAIVHNIRKLKAAFSWNKGFREYFAVKSTPNPYILELFKSEGCGVDCASETELMLADSCSFYGEDIMFTSNVTSAGEFKKAAKLQSIINLDDFSHIDYLMEYASLPELICLRLNPGGQIYYKDKLIVDFEDHKFGFTVEQFLNGVKYLKEKGVKRFGLHCQFGSHRNEADYFEENTRNLFEKVVTISKNAEIEFEFINLAGGVGIPYDETAPETDIYAVSTSIRKAYDEVLGTAGLTPIPLYLELGIFMTGPCGYFVSSVLHIKKASKTFLGLDASTNSFMSPSRYTNYHYITVAGKELEKPDCSYVLTGALCENRDRFATDRLLPPVDKGDILIFHDAGAYTYSHGNNFNGRLRPAELLLRKDNSLKLIRKAETAKDYFATLDFPIKYGD